MVVVERVDRVGFRWVTDRLVYIRQLRWRKLQWATARKQQERRVYIKVKSCVVDRLS